MASEVWDTVLTQYTDARPDEFDATLRTDTDGSYLTTPSTSTHAPLKTNNDHSDFISKSLIDNVTSTTVSSQDTMSQLKCIGDNLITIDGKIQAEITSLLSDKGHISDTELWNGIVSDLEASLRTGAMINNKLEQSPQTFLLLRELGEELISQVQNLSQIVHKIPHSLNVDVRWPILGMRRSNARHQLYQTAGRLEGALRLIQPTISALALALQVGASQEEALSKLRGELRRKNAQLAYVGRRLVTLYISCRSSQLLTFL